MTESKTPVWQPSAEEVQRHEDRALAAAIAHATPLPGAMATAFAGEPFALHSRQFRKPVASDIPALKRLDSPLYHNLIEHAKPEAERHQHLATDEDVYAMIYLFTLEPSAARALLNRGREAFMEMAAQEIGDAIHVEAINELAVAVKRNFLSMWNAKVDYEAARTDDGNFPKPPAS